MRLVVASILAMASCGCQLDQWAKNGFKIGPNYQAPETALKEHWIDYQASTQPATATATAPAATPAAVEFGQWWNVFNDPVLNSLIHDGYAQNLTLRQAGERIAEARAVRDISVGNLFPQEQSLGGSHTLNKASDRNSPAPAPFGTDQWYQNVNGGLNIGWEIDFWGRYRRAIEASDATLDASVAEYDNVMVLLLSDLAFNYVQYRTFQERLFYARQNVEIQRQAYELARNNFRAGASTERDMQQARQVYEQTRALVPQMELGLRLTNDALCTLLGIPSQDLAPRLGETGFIPTVPEAVATGIPADLLRRRPDIRRAERLVAAQSALIGVAQADLYPRFALNGSIGASAEYIGGLWATPGSLVGSIGPSFRWDILNYGRIENAVKAQEARFRQFAYAYQQTVVQADREAEDAIVSLAKSRERAVFLNDSAIAARRTVQITYDQYRGGTVDFTPVFIFELTLTQQEDALAQAKGDIALSLVNLYRALGGGWEAKDTPGGIGGPPAPAPTTQRAPNRTDLLTTRPATNPG